MKSMAKMIMALTVMMTMTMTMTKTMPVMTMTMTRIAIKIVDSIVLQSNGFGNAEYISRFMQMLIGFENNGDEEKNDNDFGNGDENGNHMEEDNDNDKDHVVIKNAASAHIFAIRMSDLNKMLLFVDRKIKFLLHGA